MVSGHPVSDFSPVQTHAPIESNGHEEHGQEHGWEVKDLVRVAIVAVAAVAVWFRWYEPFHAFSLIGVLAVLIGGYPIFREAVENIFEGRMTMELSMTIALLAALVIREFFTSLIITLFVLVAELLEGMTVNRGRRAIGDLLNLLPQTVEVFQEENHVEAPLAVVKRGDRVLVRPGGRIPVDGEVFRGMSYVDESAITGEPVPVRKGRGATVYAGTINQSGVIEVFVSRVGADTSFGKIIEAVENAEKSRAPIQKTADRLAGYLVYFALGAALLTLLFTHNLRATIPVIIVAGACGIAAGTPLAILGAIGRAASAGAIVKGGIFIEQLGKIDTVVLDKTGTLTFGAPTVIQVIAANGVNDDELLRCASIAERNSEHPLAKAIVGFSQKRIGIFPPPDEFRYQPGKGVMAVTAGSAIYVGNAGYMAENGIAVPINGNDQAATEVFVGRDREYLGSILIDDQLREEAIHALKELKSMKLQTVLLTGDSSQTTNRIARGLALDQTLSQLLPQQKLVEVQKLQQSGRKVVMVGDGINDAPALAQAEVGIAMGSGTDVARESADVVLIGNNLQKLPETLKLARRCRGIILQNFYGTLIVDSIGIVFAAMGVVTPLLAAFIHVASEMTFILNSARLLPPRKA